MHTEYITKIIDSDDKSKMEKLRDLYEDTIIYLKGTDYDKYREIECKLYEIVEGKKLSEEKAKEWVANMVPPAKWSIDEVKSVKESKNVNIPLIDFYVIMNMLYSDYGDILGEEITDDVLEKYIDMAEDWYYDDDIHMPGSEKLYCYWKHFVK